MGKKSKANRKKAPVAISTATTLTTVPAAAVIHASTATATATTTTTSQQTGRDELQTTRTVPNQNDAATDIATEASSSPPSSTASRSRAPLSGRDECPICCHVLPIANNESVYNPCCGKIICNGCIVGRQRAQLENTGYIVDGITPEEKQFMLIMDHWSNVCPFCRSKDPEDEEGYLERLLNRINICNDEDYTVALIKLGFYHLRGKGGLPQSIQKAEELFQQAYDLDNPDAAWHLFKLYERHHPDQKEKKMEYVRQGETLGDFACVLVLGDLAYKSNNYAEFTRLCMKGGRLGDDNARDNLMDNFTELSKAQLLSKDDLAITLRAHQAVNDEMKTVQRGYGKRFHIFRQLVGLHALHTST